ncbi:phage tail spike protein [Clostridium sp. YIM B02551]|uniref:phage tail spike protein n=1 Tax=Clostridium sp. YIM B02551 TaxID=2910679 RepID=UPI001EEA1939|nr:phage tail spike protein [Clostridium sp. YIM B02551]
MLQLYDLDKNKIAGLNNYKDLFLERTLDGDEVLSFSYQQSDPKYDSIKEEFYIRTKKNEYVIKEIKADYDWTGFVGKVNIEDLKGKTFPFFESVEQSCSNSVNLALVGTGWTIGSCDVIKKRTVRKANCSSYDILQEIRKVYRCDFKFDAINKKIYVYQSMGSDKGTYFSDNLNLRKLSIQSSSYDYCTRLIPRGKDSLSIQDINGGKEYVENYQYSTKIITVYWEDNRYTDAQSLLEDAEVKLDELSKPIRAYNADIFDLANLNDKYKNILDYDLGDTITLLSKDKKVKEKQRIVKIVEYPDEPERNSCDIANKSLSFEDIQAENQAVIDSADTVLTSDGRLDGSKVDSIDAVTQIKNLDSEVARITNLTVIDANIADLYANKASIDSLNATIARIGNLEVTRATITDLSAVAARVGTLEAGSATITDLNAANAKISTLESRAASIDDLLAGNLSAANMQAGFITAGSGLIANGAINDAMINNLSVSKILAGDISTTKFRIVSTSGNMLISDNTIQIKDSARVRVQIGKDATNDYNMYVWDSSGNLMFDATGLKASGIKSKIIRDDMVSDSANINGSKIEKESLVAQVNGATSTLKASKVKLDTENQTLDVAFTSLKSTVADTATTVSNQGTSISTIQGQISTKIWQQDITTAVQGVKIGGRNLLLNSDFSRDMDKWTAINAVIDSTDPLKGKCASITGVVDANGRYVRQIYNTTDLNKNSSFVIQAKYKRQNLVISTLNNPVVMLYVILRLNDGSSKFYENRFVSGTDTDWNFAVTKVEANQNIKQIEVYGFGRSFTGTVLFDEFKLETGDRNSDWSAAPEDTQVAIDNSITAKINDLNAMTKLYGQELLSQNFKKGIDDKPLIVFSPAGGTYSLVNGILAAPITDQYVIKLTNSTYLNSDFIPIDLTSPFYTMLSIYNEATTNGTLYIGIEFFDKDKNPVGTNNACYYTVQVDSANIPVNTWKTFEGFMTVASNDSVRFKAVYVKLRILTRWSANTGVTYIKDISFKQLSTQIIPTTVNRITTAESSITQLNNSISLKVDSSDFTTYKTSNDGAISSLTSRMNAAELKITSDAIVFTVRGSTAYTNDLVSKANQSALDTTNNSLGALTTRVSTAESSITQLNNSIAIKVSQTDVQNYVNSRGANLVSNGNATLGNNTNFSSFVFDGSDSYFSGGSFKDAVYNSVRYSDELIPVDVTKTYKLSIWAKTNPYTGANFYLGVAEFDCDGNSITMGNHSYTANTLSSLTVDLKNGDTVVYLDNVDNWDNNTTIAGKRGFIFWDWKNKAGYLYPPQTYSRHLSGSDIWANGSIDTVNKTITLRSAWTGGTVVAGTKLSQLGYVNASTYKYIAAAKVAIPNSWTQYTGAIGGIDTTGDNVMSKFAYGTAYVKLLLLNNRDVTGSTVWYSNLSFGVDSASQSDLTALTTRVSTSETSITQLSNSIALKVSKSDVETIKNNVIKFRYVRDWLNNSTAGSGNHWTEIKVMQGTTNLAKSKTPTAVTGTVTNPQYATDEGLNSNNNGQYSTTTSGLNALVLDLGAVYDNVDYIQVWHYYFDGRTYHGTKTEVSVDGVTWIPLFDSAISGEYKETANGHVVNANIGNVVNRITSAEASLTVQANSISAKVDSNGVIAAINLSPETVKLSASKIDLSGYVTISSLITPGSTTINGSNIITGTISADKIAVGTLTGFTLQTAADGSRVVMSGNTINSYNSSGVNIVTLGGTEGTITVKNPNGSLIMMIGNTNPNYPYWPVHVNTTIGANAFVSLSGAAKLEYDYFMGIQAIVERVRGQSNAEVFNIGSGNCGVDMGGGDARWRRDASNYMLYATTGAYFYFGSTQRHSLNANGTKSGGSIEVDNTNYGLSPVDSPKVLIEDVLFDVEVSKEGTIIELDDRLSKVLYGYAVFPSVGSAVVTEKTKNSFKVTGYTGTLDFRIIGKRIDSTEVDWLVLY